MLENRSIFDEIKAYKTKGVGFLDHPVVTLYIIFAVLIKYHDVNNVHYHRIKDC